LASYGADRFSSELEYVIDEIRAFCDAGDAAVKLRTLLFSRRTTNPFSALFAVVAIALHELLVVEDLTIGRYEAVQSALRSLDGRIDTSRGSTSPDERRRNIDVIKGLVRPHLVPAVGRSLYDNQSATDIDDAIRRSEIEAPHYELKQGLLRLDDSKSLDGGMTEKLVRTACAIANSGPGRVGALLLGVANNDADRVRISALYGIRPRKVGRRYVVGVRREAEALGETMEEYFGRIRATIASSDLR
jgi:hypothetical protein